MGESRLVGDQRLLSSFSSRSFPRVLKKVALASSNALSVQITARTLRLVRSLTSSMATMSRGSVIASTRVPSSSSSRGSTRRWTMKSRGSRASVSGREVDLIEIGDLEAQLCRQGLDEVRLRDESLADKHVTQPPPFHLLAGESGLDLVLADQAIRDEQSAQSATARGDRRHGGGLQACLHAALTFLPSGPTASASSTQANRHPGRGREAPSRRMYLVISPSPTGRHPSWLATYARGAGHLVGWRASSRFPASVTQEAWT